jgi:hypothetical protein
VTGAAKKAQVPPQATMKQEKTVEDMWRSSKRGMNK